MYACMDCDTTTADQDEAEAHGMASGHGLVEVETDTGRLTGGWK